MHNFENNASKRNSDLTRSVSYMNRDTIICCLLVQMHFILIIIILPWLKILTSKSNMLFSVPLCLYTMFKCMEEEFRFNSVYSTYVNNDAMLC